MRNFRQYRRVQRVTLIALLALAVMAVLSPRPVSDRIKLAMTSLQGSTLSAAERL